MKTLSRSAAVWIAIGCVVLGAPSAAGADEAAAGIATGQSATLLPDGRWLMLGGLGANGPMGKAAIWDPRDGSTVELSARLARPRAWHTATLLADGTVLVLGGLGAHGSLVGAAERFALETGPSELPVPAGASLRMRHTATVLTDGRVLVAGGLSDEGEALDTAEQWDIRAWLVSTVPSYLISPRAGHEAVLAADGSVILWGGVDGQGRPVADGERFDVEQSRFVSVRTPPGAPDPLALAHVEASIPEHGAVGVPVDAVISLRFSGPVPVEQLQSSSVILAGPEGPRAVRVVPAEEGRLLFITPVTPLDGGVTYALSPSAAVDAGGVFARFGPVAFSTAGPPPHRPGTSREATGPTSPDGSPLPSGAIGGGDPGTGPAGEGGGHRGGDTRRAGTDGVKPGLTVESIDPPAPATAPTPGGDAWDGDSVDLSTGIFVHRKTDLYVDGAIPIALTRTYRSGDSGARPFGIGSSHPYQIFLSATAPYQEASLILADGSAIRYVRTSPGTDFLGAVFEHVGTPTAFYGSTLTGAAFWNLATADGRIYQLGANAPLQRVDDQYDRVVQVLRGGVTLGPGTGVVTRVISPTQVLTPNDRWIIFAYDALDRIVQTRDTLGRIIAYSYDAAGRLASVTDAEGGITRYTYDGQHRMLTIRDPRGTVSLTNEYDAAGRVIRQALADLTEYRFAYSLDPSGKVVRTDVTDPRGVVRRVTFDARGYRVSDTRALGAPIEQTTTYERAVSGLVLSVTDPLGRRTAFTRDTKGNVTSVTRLAGSAQAATTSLSYVPTGGVGIRRIASITDPLGQATSFAYDSIGYPAQVTDPLGARTSVAGLGGTLRGLADGLGNGTELRRDNAVDVFAATDPLGRVTALGRDLGGRLVSRTNPLGKRVGYAYDRLDRLAQITDPAGGTTRFQHDPNGNLVTVTDARSKATRFVYDGMNRLVSRIDPLQRSESFTYDGNGNVTSATDRKGQVTVVTYDALDRPVTVSYADGSTVSHVWDAGNRLVQIVDSLAGTITRAWDLHDRLISETTALGTVAYSYDAAGRRIAMSVAGQPTVGYGYDAAGRLTQVSRGALSVSAVYDAAGRRTSLVLPNGITAEYAYDAASQLIGLTYRRGSGVLGTLTYAYDAAGNRVRAGGTWARVGLPQSVASVTHDDANRVLTFGGAALTHDANGNLTSDGARTYAWNARNQLVAVDGAGISMRFGYDALGRRQEQHADALVTRFLYDGVHAVEVFGSAGAVSLLGGLEVGEHLALGEPGDDFVPLTDALGSVLALSDEAGAVGAEYTYQPFGATAGPAAPDPNPYRFTGREVDDTGLHFHRGRYYHPALQRFIAENPIGFAGGRANLYTYAQNNPLSLTDPLGVDVDPARQPSIAATAMAAWDPVGGRAAPASGLRIAGLADADAALLERVIGAWASPEQEQALDALRPTSSVERGSCTPVGARVFRSWTVEQVAANLLKLPAGAPHRCARH